MIKMALSAQATMAIAFGAIFILIRLAKEFLYLLVEKASTIIDPCVLNKSRFLLFSLLLFFFFFKKQFLSLFYFISYLLRDTHLVILTTNYLPPRASANKRFPKSFQKVSKKNEKFPKSFQKDEKLPKR
jgi:hypothetical protein